MEDEQQARDAEIREVNLPSFLSYLSGYYYEILRQQPNCLEKNLKSTRKYFPSSTGLVFLVTCHWTGLADWTAVGMAVGASRGWSWARS